MQASTWAIPPRRYPFLDAIDYAVSELGIESFASLDNGVTYGEQALYAIAKPELRAGVLADVRLTRPRDQILNMLELAAAWPGVRVVDGDALAEPTAREVGEVDAVLLLNVLLHAVAPDWDQVLAQFAPRTRCFVIGQPQWVASPRTVRLNELPRDEWAEAMPDSIAGSDILERLGEWFAPQGRPLRDARTLWQWGITDADLEARLGSLGFALAHRIDHGGFAGTTAFANRTLVFRRG
ncbi:MAG: hypothetical protein M3Y34_04045 [Actinomycetota bacterium]|nr:hypothetical protein [Actinomycetota bacterium]